VKKPIEYEGIAKVQLEGEHSPDERVLLMYTDVEICNRGMALHTHTLEAGVDDPIEPPENNLACFRLMTTAFVFKPNKRAAAAAAAESNMRQAKADFLRRLGNSVNNELSKLLNEALDKLG
jgi:hypothetical protein